MIDYEVNEPGVAVLTWNMQDRPVNVMNDASLALFSNLIERALADPAVKGLVIASAKRDFVSGADLVSFLSDRRPGVIAAKARLTQQILRRLESGGKPVCAALGGSALGGGLEIALACHWRVAADKSALRFGLPEVTLGLLPGAGGTQRLPRLIGVRAAIPYLVNGTTVTPSQALAAGIVSELVPETQVLVRAIAWVAAQPGAVTQPWEAKGFVLPDGPLDPVALYQVFALETARITARTQNNLPAPRRILSSVFEGCNVDIDTGLKSELRHFVACVCSSASKNIIRTSFFGVADAAKLKNRPGEVPPLGIQRVGVAGNRAAIGDLVDAAVKAKLPVSWLADGQPLPAEWEGQVEVVAQASELAACEVIVAAGAMAELPTHPAGSALRLWSGAQASGPAALRLDPSGGRLLEIVRDDSTPARELAHAMDLARRLGKVPLLVRAMPGTYVERVYGAFQREVAHLLKGGVAPVLINSAARQAGMERVPVEHSPEATPVRTTPEQWQQAAADVARLKERLLTLQAAEALRCLEDGVIDSPLAADIGAQLGWGFPVHLGGPFGYVDTVGIEKFSALYEALAPDTELDQRVRRRLREQAARATSFHGD